MAVGEKSALIDAGIAIAIATAAFFLVGFLFTNAYYGSFGISDHALGFSVQDYMGASFFPLLAPVFWFVVALVVVRGLRHIGARRSKKKLPAQWPVVGTSCAVAGFFFTWRLAALGDETPTVFLGFSAADVFLFILALAFIWLMVKLSRRGLAVPGETSTGPTHQSIFFSMFAAILLLASAMSMGMDESNDQRWGCVSRPFIEFEPWPAGLDPSAEYWLIIQTPEYYFIRDNATPPREPGYAAVSASSIASATIHIEKASAPGCSGTRWPF